MVAVVALVHHRHHGVEVADSVGVDEDPAALDPEERDRRLDDHAGQAHAPGGGPEQIWLLVLAGADVEHLPVGDGQAQRPHVAGERAVDVMVLAVYVCGDRAADGDEPGARADRHEVALRDHLCHQRVEARAAGNRDDAVDHRDRAGRARAGGVEHHAAGVLRGVAIRSSQATRDHAPLVRVRDLVGQLVHVRRHAQLRGRRHGPPPPREQMRRSRNAHAVCIPRPKTRSQQRPINWRGRSDSTMSSGASPLP